MVCQQQRHQRQMVRDLMLESVELRFGTACTPHPIQWLSDNGSAYRAHETIDFAIGLGLVPYFTPVRSPQSNGMSEVFSLCPFGGSIRHRGSWNPDEYGSPQPPPGYG
jgi:transposase InsO family protein